MSTTCAWRRCPRRSHGESKPSCSIPGRSRSWSFAKRGRWILHAEAQTQTASGSAASAGSDRTHGGQLIDGTAIGRLVRRDVAEEVERLKALGITPGLSVVLVGDDPASAVYVRSKGKACEEAGMRGETIRLPADTSED